ncbi:MAG: acetamidase/formamidase family protein [Cypionkella sp.]
MTSSSQPFSLDQIPLARQREAWAEQLATVALLPSAECNDITGVSQFFRSSSGAMLATLAGTPQHLTGLTQLAKGNFRLTLVRHGRATLRTPGHLLHLADGDLVLQDASVFELDLTGDWELIVMLLPIAPLLSRLGRNKIDYPLLLGSSVASLAACSVLRALGTNFDTLEQADISAGEIAVVELLASAMLATIKAPEGDLTAVQAAHFRRVALAIDRRLADVDLHPADIAREEGMSTRYLQRLFAQRGESFSEYLKAQRLEHCRADLLDPNYDTESIASIGQRWGFRDQAHFSRSFTAAFSATPTAVRRARKSEGAGYGLRGKPSVRVPHPLPARHLEPAPRLKSAAGNVQAGHGNHYLPANNETVHWGYLSRTLAPALRIKSGEVVTVETLTQHAGDDWDRMVEGDAGAQSVFEWTAERKAINRRGAGPVDASVFGRGAGEGFGVHICTGPIHVSGAEPGDFLEIEILDIRPRASGNPLHAGKAFASNVSAWWGYQYKDMIGGGLHETVTIFEIDVNSPSVARPLYSYRWTPQTDPSGVVHATMDYPGVRVDHASVLKRDGILAGIEVPARMHFGFVGIAPREADFVDTIPPGPFGGNIDNWRAGKGTKLYLPVQVEGALLSVGDGHFAQSDGEINGTGLECSLTGDLRIVLHKAGAEPAFLRGTKGPIIETEDCWVIQSFSYSNYLRELGSSAQSEVYRRSTVDLALRNAFRQTRRFLMDGFRFSEDEALTLMSLAADFGITQVADGNFGAHALIKKSLLAERAVNYVGP